MDWCDMDKTDFKTLPILAAVANATITGRPFSECGQIGYLCNRLPMEGFMSLFQKVYPAKVDDEKIWFHLSSIVSWYRTSGRHGYWDNKPFFEWLESQSLTPEDKPYALYGALLLCVDRAIACGIRDHMHDAEQWFDCAQWLRFSLAPDEVNEAAIQHFSELELNLSNGRHQGAQSQKKAAADRDERILNMNADLLKHPDTKRWTLDKRAAHICDRIFKNEKTKERYSPGTIIGKIQGQA